ncbi:hypothetical protein N7457_006413 [Penicillium paradoxum]|uniref:uncharacterized protein n=1 Tax=Penicillium paradoxum TaxID=176176 RepID=UPI00254723BA|nr:uncharacterized protein N7457_006413 [Penicillium paradoxum]KAJ5781253.1 hypothetical protein N7457_006413 [Penicillium paradoxum]
MPQQNDQDQYELVLNALKSQIGHLRHSPEKRQLVIQRLNSLSILFRVCARKKVSSRLRYLSDILQRDLPRQVRLLESNLDSGVIVADAIDRMINRVTSLPDTAFDEDRGYEADTEASEEESVMDPSDDNYIALVLLGPTWNDLVVDAEVDMDL